MLNPAFAIFSIVASCRLPLGNPNLSTFFVFFIAWLLSKRRGFQAAWNPSTHALICQFPRLEATFFFFAIRPGHTAGGRDPRQRTRRPGSEISRQAIAPM